MWCSANSTSPACNITAAVQESVIEFGLYICVRDVVRMGDKMGHAGTQTHEFNLQFETIFFPIERLLRCAFATAVVEDSTGF